MTSLERYFTTHLRSLFISKFRFKVVAAVTIIQNMRWVFITKPSFYPLAALLCFIVTGQWPLHKRIKRYVHGSRSASALLQLSVRFGDSFSRKGLRLLQKFRFLHFPYIDSALLSADSIFDAFFTNSTTLSLNWRLLLATLQELEVLIGGSLTAVHTISKTIHLKCLFSTVNLHSLYKLITTIRAIQLPLAESSSLEKSCHNAFYSWTGGRLTPKGL